MPFDIDAWQVGQGPNNPEGGYTLQDTPFDEYWNTLPSLHNKNDACLTVQGHSFRGRMAVLKYLITEIDDPSLWGRRNQEWHWLWAYAAQLDWQHRSGRLFLGGSANDDDDKLSTKSWWSYMNFCFSICILLGAKQGGVVAEEIVLDEESERLVSTDTAIQKCMESWADLFQNGYQAFRQDMDKSHSCSGELRFELQKQVWVAHTNVVLHHTGGSETEQANMAPVMHALVVLLPDEERDFALGWCRMVELLAACCIPTDLVALKQDGAGNLPMQIVTDQRLQEWRSSAGQDLKRFKTVKLTHLLLEASPDSLERMARFWKRVVRTNDISRSMPTTIRLLSNGTRIKKLRTLLRLVYLYVRPRGITEWSIAFAVLSAAVALPMQLRY